MKVVVQVPWLSVDYLRRNEGNVKHNSFLCHEQIQSFSVQSQSQLGRPPPPNGKHARSDEYWSLLLALYLDMPLLEQRFVAVGWWVWNDHPVILALSPETFVQ